MDSNTMESRLLHDVPDGPEHINPFSTRPYVQSSNVTRVVVESLPGSVFPPRTLHTSITHLLFVRNRIGISTCSSPMTTTLAFDHWVFNTEAHPLPVIKKDKTDIPNEVE
ncbi:hypothetical protein KUCAC02_019350 [Chaenocephalus aceratus]|uniref:Uncharacterized protein n=1 Tax=Chaenocephalus aceratus TaxID=36190 RepID=A0ACB9VMY6_CHAAC|nr:hypothetical protein KUCAC02_019350 [Chaenocephalus aceratus]